MEPPRSLLQRKQDTLGRLESDVDASYAYFRIVPGQVQAWREVNELAGRTLMRDGGWLA